MTSARFVGRAEQLAELRAALRDAGDSRPSLAFLGGESGVGKSRLADELKRHAREAGARVLSGDCVELGDDELPYAPLLTALRPLVRDGDPALEALSPPLRSALDAILPGLGVGASSGDAAQSRVFEALRALLEGLSDGAPVVLVVEDLHWADSSTRSFIGFLARTVCKERLLLLGTYRSDELHRRHPLRPLLAELASDPYTRLVDLPRFTPEELGEQLADILSGDPDPDLVQRVYSRSEGNALYAEEIVAAGPDGRGALPPTLRDALMLRVERLSPRAQEVIRWLACQPAADHALVVSVAGLEQAELRDALREAVASQIVVTVGEESYGFRHALLREVVYDDLLPGERTDMHGALAAAVESRIEDGDSGAHVTAQAAHHWASAGNQPRALAAAVRAALAAERVNAFAEAQALFERALALWERVPDPEALVGVDEFELLRHAAVAADQAGDPTRQEALLRRALGLVAGDADPGRAALVHERLSQSLWSQHRQDDSLAALREGLALLSDEPSAPRAKLLAQLARRRMVQSRFAEAAECAREALEVARAVGHRESEAIALNALGTALGDTGEVDAGVAYLHESRVIAQEEGLEMEEGGAWINISDVLNLAGRTEEGLAAALHGLETAYTQDWRTTDWLKLTVSDFRFHLGDWSGADEVMPAASRRQTGGTLLYWQTCRAQLALARGDVEAAGQAVAILAAATAELTEPQFVGAWGVLSAELLRRSGDLDEARAVVDDALDRIEYCSEDVMRISALALTGLRVEGDAGEAARDRRDEDAAAVARTRAAALLERSRVAAESAWVVEAAQLATAEAEHARASGAEDAVARWRAAAERWDELRRPYQAAYARWRLAEALMAAREREAATAAAAEALAGARRLGSAWLVDEVESLAARARLQLGEGERAAGAADPGRDESEDPFGLTPRERDVLALVAAGATNREIGERLHMAEKTASVHVSRILAKLNVRSRTEAAAVAHRQGLVTTA